MAATSEKTVLDSPSKKKRHVAKSRSKEGSPVTAHNWKDEKQIKMQDAGISPVEVEFYDDGTVTFFWLFFHFSHFVFIHSTALMHKLSTGEPTRCQSCFFSLQHLCMLQ